MVCSIQSPNIAFLVISDNAELEISLSEEQIARIVNSTFEEADLDRNGLIDINEYHVSLRTQ